jgi:ribonuclease Y
MLVLAAVLISVLITGVIVVFGLQLFGGTSVSEARKEAETIRREAKIEAREDAVRVRAEVEREVLEQRARITKIEERVLAREDEVELRQKELTRREQGITDREVHVKELQDDLKEAKQRELTELERVAGMTVNEAKARLLEQSEELVRHDLARRVRQLDEEAQSEAKRRARNLVADALQRVAASHAAETTSSLIELPSDDMKGRTSGREGRNIRTLEHLTGVDVIVDDTPQAVVLSSFDPIRREIAKITLLKLVEDGRIQPARIEEMYYQSKAEIEEHIVQGGEQAVFEANCGEFHEEIVKLLGRLNCRTTSSSSAFDW